jgi:hypothetical protein
MIKGSLGKLFFFLFILLLLAVGYFYFFQLSPVFVNKPVIEKPTTLENKEIYFIHIAYLLNELDAYKLHKEAFTGELAVIEVYIKDTGQHFFVQVNEGKLIGIEVGKPDLVISTKKETLFRIFEGDIEKRVFSAVSDGSITLNLISDEKTLALKGYKVIYDKISKNTITGNLIGGLYPTGFIRGLELVLFLLFSLTVFMILEKEI